MDSIPTADDAPAEDSTPAEEETAPAADETVEVTPVSEEVAGDDASAEESTPSEEVAEEETAPDEAVALVEDSTPAADETVEVTPVSEEVADGDAPVEDPAPAQDETSLVPEEVADDNAPTEDSTPAEEETSIVPEEVADDNAPTEDSTPAEEETSIVPEEVADDNAPTEDSTPAEEETAPAADETVEVTPVSEEVAVNDAPSKELAEQPDPAVDETIVVPEASTLREEVADGDAPSEEVAEETVPIADETADLTLASEEVPEQTVPTADLTPVSEEVAVNDAPVEDPAPAQDETSIVPEEVADGDVPSEEAAEEETVPAADETADLTPVSEDAADDAAPVEDPAPAVDETADLTPVSEEVADDDAPAKESTPSEEAAEKETVPAADETADLTPVSEEVPEQTVPTADLTPVSEEVADGGAPSEELAEETTPATDEAVAPVEDPTPAEDPAPAVDETVVVPDDPAPLVDSDTKPRSRWRPAALLGLGVGALILILWGSAAAATTQHVFGGSTVSGVAVGGMSASQAEQVLTETIEAQLAETVTLAVPGDDGAPIATDTLVPAESGVSLDAAASIDTLTSFTLNPITIVDRLTGAQTQAVTTVDPQALTAALNARITTLSQGTVDAAVTLDGTTPVLTPAVAGSGVDVASSVQILSRDWPLGQETVTLVAGRTEPTVTDADAQALIDNVLTPLLASDVTVSAVGTQAASTAQADAVLTPAEIAATASVVNHNGTLSVHLDPAGLREAVLEDMGTGVETAPVDATFTIEGSASGTPVFVPGTTGLSIDGEALADAVLATTNGTRTLTLPVTTTEPEHNEAEAQWGVTEIIGEYATPFFYDPQRTQNLIAGAAAINGTVVLPGQTFSLTEALGPVDYEHGFASAGVYVNGVHSDSLGGGLSQVATTVFNAGFEAGMDDVEHHPHSVWFTRYPAGREATLWTGVLDVKWTNSTPYAVLVQAWVSDDYVHVRLWSTHYYDVSIVSGEHSGYRPVRTETSTAAGCEPYSGGEPGFDITVTRSRKAPDGTGPADDVLTTSYAADNALRCVAPHAPA
ncbi:MULTISPECIES: VanW family protein [Actinomyces]|uniref:VanW family protein n=1 Tax=Actinomyces respiraculi TaxID=2744574 RepID=A0A7T0LL24_9ACTO|nr:MULTISPECIES: VanW family protein [Actinomyces]QPL05737.1 VanW family protein [Actinomyces respiraculi]